MLDLVQILADSCQGIGPIVSLVQAILGIFQIAIPIMLIIWGSIDLGKAVMANDDKEIKGATGKLVKRAVAAVVVFFIPFIVNLVMGVVSDSTSGVDGIGKWADCWKAPDKDAGI